MKLLVVIASVIALCVGNEIPQDDLPKEAFPLEESPKDELPEIDLDQHEIPPLDNSHYVPGKSRYIWMDSGRAPPQLVDVKYLEEIVDDEKNRNSRDGADNQYWLFTRRNRVNRQILRHENQNSVRNSNFVNNAPTMVIVHGWNNNGNSPMNPDITTGFLNLHDGNVIVVDWSRAAGNIYYPASVRAVPSVGEHLGRFLVWLLNFTRGNWTNVHLVGFSLGAHVVGIAGRHGRPRRVTGLDPAGPGWEFSSNRISRNSGVYVELIHTNGDTYGNNRADGHANFYPNGGMHNQPGCGLLSPSCSHGRSTDLFASSVRTNHFNGIACNSVHDANRERCNGPGTLRMGNAFVNKNGNGIFHLTTRNAWPF